MAPPCNAHGSTRKRRYTDGFSSQAPRDAMSDYLVRFGQHRFASTNVVEKYDLNK